jgi:cellulose synthase/poly-beta-1,6-N-acetylglucosamine synthase-like glycosyltransferase
MYKNILIYLKVLRMAPTITIIIPVYNEDRIIAFYAR